MKTVHEGEFSASKMSWKDDGFEGIPGFPGATMVTVCFRVVDLLH